MAAPDFNQQLFASGQMPGALGAHGGGSTSSVPLSATLGLKDAKHYWFEGANPPQALLAGMFGGDTNGIGGIFTPKSGDKFIQGLTNVGGGGTVNFGGGTTSEGSTTGSYFQSMVAVSRGESSERGV